MKLVGGALVSAPVSLALSGCGARQVPATSPFRSRYSTIGHEILDIELEHNPGISNYLRLDSILAQAEEGVPTVEPYEQSDRDYALLSLYAIDDILKSLGFRYEKARLLCYGLEKKRIDCDAYSAIYLAVGELLELPIKMVRAPAHTFIRWQLGEKGYLNWETTIGAEKDDRYYIEYHRIARRSEGITSLRSLHVNANRDEILANAYVNTGVEWLNKCRLNLAIARFKEAIRRDPKYETPYYNIGLTYYHIGQVEEAVRWCRQAVALNPNHIKSHAVLQSAYSILGQKRKSKRHLRKILELNPNYYHVGAVERRRKSKSFC